MPYTPRRREDLPRPTRCFLALLKAAHIADVGREMSGNLDLIALNRPAEDHSQIVNLALEPAVRDSLLRATPNLEMSVGIGDEECRMVPPRGVGLAARR